MDFLVGTFNHPSIYQLTFTPSTSSASPSLLIKKDHPALSGHSWLSLSSSPSESASPSHLYATAWTSPTPSIASYKLLPNTHTIQYLNAKPVSSTPGYITSNTTHIFSVSGPSASIFRKEADGSIGPLIQEIDFISLSSSSSSSPNQSEARGKVAHGDFGGLRHGAHSIDLSPDGKSLYIADIGRNCIWTYKILHERRGTNDAVLEIGSKHVSPRLHDGPRHTYPHPNGRILYVLQEHSSMVDVFSIAPDGTSLTHLQACSVLPSDKNCQHFWADEVRYSTGPDPTKPKHLFASNRGLEKGTKGYVAAYKLNEDGTLESEEAVDIWETPTSGGIANAIEAAPWREEHGEMEYLALCDSEEGRVSVLSFDGRKIREVASVSLGKTEDGKVVGAATPVWL